MLTIPNEIVPLQIARGARAAERPVLRSVGAVAVPALRAVLSAIPNIKGITIGPGIRRRLGSLDSVGAVGRSAARLVGGHLPRHLERALEGLGESVVAGDAGSELGHGRLTAAGRGRLGRGGPPRAPTRRMAAGARLRIPGAPLLHHALDRVSAGGALGRLPDRPPHG